MNGKGHPMTTQEFHTIRLTLGLSQESLAEALGYSRNTIGRLETGRTPIKHPVAMLMRQLRDNPERALGLDTTEEGA